MSTPAERLDGGGASLTDTCIRHPVLAWVIMLLVLLFGIIAYSRIGVSQFPDVDEPTVTVSLSWEGAAPEAMEQEVVEPVEATLMQVEGVTRIRSSANHGSASISLTLDISRDIDAAIQEVQSRVAQVQRRLPDDVDPPSVSKSNPDDNPIMWLGLSGTHSPQVLADYARYKVGERLQLVPGVGEVMLGGSVDRNIRIWLRPEALTARGVTAAEVLAAVRRNHVEVPAGEVKGGGRATPVRVLGEAADLRELGAIRVGGTAQAPVRLDEVAFLEDGFADVTRLTRINGEPGQGIGIRKQRGSNALAVGQAVRTEVGKIAEELPEGMSIGINFDSTPFIAESMDALTHEVGLAVLLTALVCWAFLRSWSSTLNVILAIPMSLLGTVAVAWALGWTLNTFTLLGLGLAVGIVVDDAILVMENIVRRRELGEDAPTAASRGTREILFSALVATVAIIAIVIPVVFMRGTTGAFFLQFGVALSVAVLFSYVEAVTLAPSRCARLLRDLPPSGHGGRAARTYTAVVGWAVRFPAAVLLIATVLFAGGAFAAWKLPREVAPSQDVGRLRLRFTTEIGSDLPATDALIRRAETIIRGHPAIERVYIAVGGFGSSSANGGFGFLTLVDRDQRPPQKQVIADLRKQLGSIAGLSVGIQELSLISSGRSFPIDFAFLGGDFDELRRQLDRVTTTLETEGYIVDAKSDVELGLPELRVLPDRRKCLDLGVDLTAVADTLTVGVSGTDVGRWDVGGRRIDVRAALMGSARDDPEDLLGLYVRSGSGALIPLADLVTLEERASLQTITRRDRERAAGLDANVAAGRSQGEVLERLRQLTTDLPPGVSLRLLGSSADFGSGFLDLIAVAVIGLIVAYLILAAQFDSWAHPLTVLSVLPLALAGGAVALFVAGQSLSIFSAIGFILLMGLAKKNSIVLVDFAKRAQEDGLTAAAAMRQAAPLRLRPIIMTAVATIAGSMPIALGMGAGAEVRRPMALCIVGGMIVATALSLVVVPAVYVLVDRLRGGSRG